MTYRDDDLARTERANALIDEIAKLERQKVAHAAAEQRLEAARQELAGLGPTAAMPSRTPGLGVHLLVFSAATMLAYAGYMLVARL